MRTQDYQRLASTIWRKFVATGKHIWRFVYSKEEFIVGFKNLDGSPQDTLPISVTVKRVDHPIEPALRDFAHRALERFPGALRRLEDCLLHGYPGLAGYLDGTIIGYGWWVDHMTCHPHTEFYAVPLVPGDIYGFDLFIAKEFRGLHRGLQFMFASERYCREQGYKRYFAIVRTDNKRSLGVHHQWSWEEIERRTVVRYLSVIMRCGGRWRWRDPMWF